MGANYNRLFKLLIDRRMKKGELCRQAEISPSTLAKLYNGDNVNTNVLVRICNVLECDIADIMEIQRG